MISLERTVVASDAHLAWARETLLEPAVWKLLRDGRAHRPDSYADDDTFVAAISGLFDVEMRRLRDVKLRFVPGGKAPLRDEHQRLKDLTEPTGLTRMELYRLLRSVDLRALHDEVRFIESSRRTGLRLGGSALALIGVPKHVSGSNVYAADTPAPPTGTAQILRELGLSPKHARQYEDGYETTLYLIEVARDWVSAHRADGLPEGTYYDPAHPDYPSEVRDRIEQALFDKARGEGDPGDGRYEPSTGAIARAQVDSFLASVHRHRDPYTPALPLESGMILRGHPPARHEFLGGDLGFIQHAGRAGARPRLALPRNWRDGRAKRARRPAPILNSLAFPDADCAFWVPSRESPLSAHEMNYAMWEVFERPGTPRFADVFTDIEPRLVAEAGADPREVAYAYAQTAVGKLDGSGRSRVTLLLANRFGEPMGWGIRRGGGTSEAERRALVRWAEQHVARMAPRGIVDQLVQYYQYAGIQTMQIECLGNRLLREGILLAAHLLLTRAELQR